MKVVIEKPKEFNNEVKKLIDAHYALAKTEGFFAKKYPVIYKLFLEIHALGLDT